MRWSITQLNGFGAMTQPCFMPVSVVNSSDRKDARCNALLVSEYDVRVVCICVQEEVSVTVGS